MNLLLYLYKTFRKSIKCNSSSIDKQLAILNSFPKHKFTQNNVKFFNCKLCSKTFADKSKFNRHSKIHADVKKFECKKCVKKFTSKESLIVHERIHANQCPFQCNICSKQFYDRSNLAKHKDVHKSNLERIVCETCGKSFRNKFSYKKHYDNIHRKVKREIEFECSVCKKLFKNVSDLKRHRLVHEDKKKFCCTICNVYFRRKDNFERHNKYFHKPLLSVNNECDRSECGGGGGGGGGSSSTGIGIGDNRLELEQIQREIENQHQHFRKFTTSNLLEIAAKNSERLFENSPFAELRNEFLQNALDYDRIPVLKFGTKPYNENESTEICKKIFESCNENCGPLLTLPSVPSTSSALSASSASTITRPPLANAKSVIVSNVQRTMMPDRKPHAFESETNVMHVRKYEEETEPQPINQRDDETVSKDPTDFCNSLITTYRDFD